MVALIVLGPFGAMGPFTVSIVPGVVVPIPTFPALSIRTLSVRDPPVAAVEKVMAEARLA